VVAGGPTVFVCWKEAEFLAKLSELGYGTFQEGFEDDQAWASARSPLTAPSVVSQGIKWESNHPAPPAENEITTGPGPARSGEWAVFDLSHGYATGTEKQCDVDIPPEHCLLALREFGGRVVAHSTPQALILPVRLSPGW